MLFLSDSSIETRQKLLVELGKGKIDAEKAFQQALALDPDDHVALMFLAESRAKAGDAAGAEELYWRGIRAQPCAWLPYIGLSRMLTDQQPLAKGLAELAIRKLLLDPKALEGMATEESPFFPSPVGMEKLEGLSEEEKLEMLAGALRELRELEPLPVTARLRSLRLVHHLQETDELEPEQVDALVQEGESIVPLLVGVLRGWTRDVLTDNETYSAANSMALLGEIGEPGAIPYLLELVTLKDAELSGPCDWALDRIVEQHPEQVAQVFAEVAPRLDGQEKIAIAERLLRFPQIVGTPDLFEKLFEDLDRLDAEDREACFQILMSTAIMVLGRPGIEFCRTMLRLHGGVLSRKCRRDCDDMIQEFGSIAIPPRPPAEPSPYTVYDLCEGTVDWDAENEESLEEDDEPLPPEPVRKKSVPGRNDPCWCGSGKKYKKCHLDSDDAADRDAPEPRAKASQDAGAEFDDLRRRIGEFMSQAMTMQETALVAREFFGTDKSDDELGPMLVVDWVIHDRISPSFGRTVMEEYLGRHASSLTDRERQFIESSARSYVDLFEVQEVREGSGVEVKSLTSEETFFVHDISTSKVSACWDGLYGRVVNGERGIEFSGTAIAVPRMHLEAVRQRLEEEQRRTGLSWPVYLKRNWPSVYAQHAEILSRWMDSVSVSNNDGEELVISKAVYQVLDRGALLASLRSSAKIHEDEKGTSFVWVSAEENGTVLGTLRIVGAQLALECNSKERLKRGKRLLADLAGASVKFETDEFTTQEEIKRNVRRNPTPPRSGKDEIPPEVKRMVEREFMEDFYAKWVDRKIPAIDGKTPRQAVKNAAGKRKVAELLKQIENIESHKRKAGEYAYDVAKLRAELGVKG